MNQPAKVLVLGAGINGAAVARELLLNDVSVTVVDTGDVATGATAYSSRLIHGGLRYLEHGEFDLVRESLAERTRLLRLAPHFVRPLRLFIPIAQGPSLGGWRAALGRFFGRSPRRSTAVVRGTLLVRTGLWLYDRYAHDQSLPRHAMVRVGASGTPPVDAAHYGWLGCYYDAQILYPERLVLAMLADARQLAAERSRSLDVYTYHRATLSADGTVEVRRGADDALVDSFPAAAIVNATGAWIDHTLKGLSLDERRLIGGTKGSHFLTAHRGLRDALQGSGLYAEAADGRPVFILPFGPYSLVGTTDIPFAADPGTAHADADEIAYLRAAVGRVFPSIRLDEGDVDFHYSGVRPLPYVGPDASNPGAISRRHQLVETAGAVPVLSAIGGKLTTCRSFAEQIAATVLRRIGLPIRETSRERVFPGGEAYPREAPMLQAEQRRVAAAAGVDVETVAAVWSLVGTRAEQYLAGATAPAETTCVGSTALPRRVVRRLIREEWVARLPDLVERRLMLLYQPGLNVGTLRELAQLLSAEGRIEPHAIDDEVAECVTRLESRYGKQVVGGAT